MSAEDSDRTALRMGRVRSNARRGLVLVTAASLATLFAGPVAGRAGSEPVTCFGEKARTGDARPNAIKGLRSDQVFAGLGGNDGIAGAQGTTSCVETAGTMPSGAGMTPTVCPEVWGPTASRARRVATTSGGTPGPTSFGEVPGATCCSVVRAATRCTGGPGEDACVGGEVTHGCEHVR